MRRTELKRTVPLRSSGRPKPRTKPNAEKVWQRKVRQRDGFTCQRCGKYDRYIHAHHIATRSRRPDLRYDVANGICLDLVCHAWVHANPVEAQALGFLSDAKYEMRS